MQDDVQKGIQEDAPKKELSAWHLLLIIPFIAVLWVPFYASKDPVIFGMPFFYVYQFGWVIISALLTAVVYFKTKEK